MTDDPCAAIRAIVGNGTDPLAALRVLRHAIIWSAATVAAALSGSGDEPGTDDAALELVIAVDDAVAEADLLVDVVPRLADHALAGVRVTEYLRRQIDALVSLSDQVAAAGHEYEAVRDVEAELIASGAEHDRLTARLAELTRLRELADSLPELRDMHDELTRRESAMLAETDAAEAALLATAERVGALSAERLSRLGTSTAEALTRLRDTESRWAAVAAQFADAERKVTKLRDEYLVLSAALRAHAEVDADLTARLDGAERGSVTDRVRTVLADVQSLLDQVDTALGDTLARYDRINAEAHRELHWREDS
ncbi:hypothetical protein [Nocardia arthritidis]|uniref:Uncharacterized protein n=1 Tax=Nocardia arthritidis TaxID=228602 RepID=A0A6G9YBH6_9NOCA|nr:hypothetical protein [Nocardia arthritidis]QIS10504.1 hypothetical protein F5544_13075 [Nocardia arthritidis]